MLRSRTGDGSGCDIGCFVGVCVICGNMIQLIWSVDTLMPKLNRTA